MDDKRIVEPVAYLYRWKLDGEWTDWRAADHSQKSRHLLSLEERPLCLLDALTTAQARIAELEAGRHADRVALVEFMVDKAKDIADGILETDADGCIKAFEAHQADAAAREIGNEEYERDDDQSDMPGGMP